MVSTTNTSLLVSADEVFDEMTMNKFLKRECTVDEYYAYYTSTVSNKDWSERHTIGLFVFGLQSEIGKRVEMYNPKSILDAYHLAKWQESMNNIMRKNSRTSLFSSSKIDHSKEVKEDNMELELRGDEKGNEGQSSGEEINKFEVKVLEIEENKNKIGLSNLVSLGKILNELCEEKVEGIGIKSREWVELDDKNMNKVSLDISKDADTGERFSNDIKIDSKDWVACDSNCEESEIFIASNELESHTLVELSKEGNKDDKSALIHVSEDKDCGLVGKFSSDSGVKIDCVGSIFVEASTVVEKPKATVTNIKKDTTYDILDNQGEEVIENKEVMGLVDLSCGKSGLKINLGKSGISHFEAMYVKHIMVNSSNTDMNINFNKKEISRKGHEDTDVLVSDLTLGKNGRCSWELDHIDGPEENPDYDCGLVHMGIRLAENEFIIPKTCRSLGCIKNVTSGSHVQKVLVNVHNDDDLLNQQKKHKEVSEQVTERFIHVNNRIRNVLLVSSGYGMFKFGMWEWRKRKKASHIKFRFCKFDKWEWRKRKKIDGARCEFNYKKCNFDIWKWPKRKKERRKESCEEIMFSWNEEMHNMFILWFDYSRRVIVKLEKKIELYICLVQRRFYWLNIKYDEGMVKVGKVVYKLELLEFAKNAMCVLCVQIKEMERTRYRMGALTACEDDELSAVEPQMILARRMHKRDNKVDVYVGIW
ncbi:hypothetical protein Tco_0959608 [Tanacetum coccineum]